MIILYNAIREIHLLSVKSVYKFIPLCFVFQKTELPLRSIFETQYLIIDQR